MFHSQHSYPLPLSTVCVCQTFPVSRSKGSKECVCVCVECRCASVCLYPPWNDEHSPVLLFSDGSSLKLAFRSRLQPLASQSHDDQTSERVSRARSWAECGRRNPGRREWKWGEKPLTFRPGTDLGVKNTLKLIVPWMRENKPLLRGLL